MDKNTNMTMSSRNGSRGNILVVDDLPDNLDLLCKILSDGGYSPRPTTRGSVALQAARMEPPDLILLDIRMPEMDGFEVCRQLKDDPDLRDIPVIFISALHEIEDKVKAFEAGGVDYLTKPFHEAEVLARVWTHLNLFRMQTRLEELVAERNADLFAKTLALQDEIEERKKVEAELRQAEFRYRTVADFTYAWEYWEGNDGTLHYISPSCQRISGYAPEEFIADPHLLHNIVQENDRPTWEAHHLEAQANHLPREMEFRILGPDGKIRHIEHSCLPVIGEDGSFLGLRVSNRDVSFRKELEKELRQAQKMEAIGTLAGGIAHDFNNILASIFGFTELALCVENCSPKIREYLETVLDSAKRAKDLVRQILTFSRQTEQELKPLQVSLVVKETIKLLRVSLPASIAVKQNIVATDLVLADPTYVHQIVMNLCTNAFHAMREKGGTLTVSLLKVELEADVALLSRGYIPGDYLLLEVEDTGFGMDAVTREKIFDPYFTTKAEGEGTGLGLSVVAGIVRNLKGHIMVSSEPGVGSVFRIYLPVHKSRKTPLPEASIRENAAASLSGTGKILVVDDEDKVVSICRELLESAGYSVFPFTESQQALSFFLKDPSGVDLVVTDLNMAKLNGIELARRLLAIRPVLPLILCTGYADVINEEKARKTGLFAGYIQKPFVGKEFLNIIRETLHGRDKQK